MNQPEAYGISISPLKVIYQRPMEVAPHICTVPVIIINLYQLTLKKKPIILINKSESTSLQKLEK